MIFLTVFFFTLVMAVFLGLVSFVSYSHGFREGQAESSKSGHGDSDPSVDLISSAIECVDQALSPTSHTLPWSKPALESAREALERAYKSETEAL